MKRLFVGCAMLLVCLSGRAQTDFRFADSTARWNLGETYYWFPSGSDVQTVIYSVQKDTVIHGSSYQKIIPAPFQNSSPFFIRKDSTGKVFALDSSLLGGVTNTIIYDFSLTEGDTFELVKPDPFFAITIFMTVDSVDTVVMGYPRKRMFLSCLDGVNGCFSVTWIEGIGSLNSHFLSPLVFEFEPEGSAYELLCFTENGVTYSFSQSCFVGVNDFSENPNSIIVSPNPAGTYLRVELTNPSAHLQSVRLYSVTGKEVIHTQPMEQTAILNTQLLSSGVYFCRVVLDNGNVMVRKIQIE